MKTYLAGIGGTFMTGLARLMKECGISAAGCDTALWPPMSTQLEQIGITPDSGWNPDYLSSDYDAIIIGNVLSRGNPFVEAILNQNLPFTSGPQWLSEHILINRPVLAVAGTHGKTTTTAMLAWILHHAKLAPGFLSGGMAKNFNASAGLGQRTAPFVIEADEYDTAFFDKRPKFMHYRPQVLILSNLEFDHADIYTDLAAIKRQFHYLLRTVPSNGRIIYRAADTNLQAVIDMDVWTPCDTFGLDGETADWIVHPDSKGFEVFHHGTSQGRCCWDLPGRHNAANALSAIIAAYRIGVPVTAALLALEMFQGVSRRLEVAAKVAGITVYDDFAHHPTEISASLAAVKERVGNGRVLAVFEPRSNSMKMGTHQKHLHAAFRVANKTFFYRPQTLNWQPERLFTDADPIQFFADTETLLHAICAEARRGDAIVIMSNGNFDHLPVRIGEQLATA